MQGGTKASLTKVTSQWMFSWRMFCRGLRELPDGGGSFHAITESLQGGYVVLEAFSFLERFASELVVKDHFLFHAKIVQCFNNGIDHGRRSAQVVLDFRRIVMGAQVIGCQGFLDISH